MVQAKMTKAFNFSAASSLRTQQLANTENGRKVFDRKNANPTLKGDKKRCLSG